jgi:hypothetical protein
VQGRSLLPRPYPAIPGVTVIGLVGQSGHGKDEVAKMLIRNCPGTERFGFSDGISYRARLNGEMVERNPTFLQPISSGIAREHFLNAMYYAISDRKPTVAVITGIRAPDEAELIRSMGGRIVRVRRVDREGRPYVNPDRDSTHPIEQMIPKIHADAEIVATSGDFVTLEMMAKQLLAA